jgi:hypothetical protein
VLFRSAQRRLVRGGRLRYGWQLPIGVLGALDLRASDSGVLLPGRLVRRNGASRLHGRVALGMGRLQRRAMPAADRRMLRG